MMKIPVILSAVAFCLIGLAYAEISSVSLTASVPGPQVFEGEGFMAELLLRWAGEAERQFDTPVLSGTKNCVIISTTVENRIVETNGSRYSVRRYAYGLRPEGLGMAWFGTAAVRYSESGRERFLISPDLSVEVVERPAGRRGGAFFLFLAVLILSVGLFVAGLFAVRKGKRNLPVRKESSGEETGPLERLLAEFVRLKRGAGAQTPEHLYGEYLRLLRGALACRFGEPGRRFSDRVILDRLSPDDPLRRELPEVFETAGAVRYAGRAVSSADADALRGLLERIIVPEDKENRDG